MTEFGDIIITDEGGSASTKDGGGVRKKPEKGSKSVHVGFVMDHSGSMLGSEEDSINNFNEQIGALKRKSKEFGIDTYVTLVEFDNRIIVKYEETPVEDVELMKSYWTEGLTSLNDAIMKATTTLEKALAEDPREDKSALLITITDGDENSSKEFPKPNGTEKIKKEIKLLEKTNKWTFTFMGADLDVQNVAVAGFGFAAGNTLSFNKSKKGFMDSGQNTIRGVETYYMARNNGETYTNDFHNTTTECNTDNVTNTAKEEAEE